MFFIHFFKYETIDTYTRAFFMDIIFSIGSVYIICTKAQSLLQPTTPHLLPSAAPSIFAKMFRRFLAQELESVRLFRHCTYDIHVKTQILINLFESLRQNKNSSHFAGFFCQNIDANDLFDFTCQKTQNKISFLDSSCQKEI